MAPSLAVSSPKHDARPAVCQGPLSTALRYDSRMGRPWREFVREAAALLRDRREAAGVSQAALGRMLNVTRGGVNQWESGETDPTPDSLERWAEALGVSIDFGINGVDARASTLATAITPLTTLQLEQVAAFARALPQLTARELGLVEALVGIAGRSDDGVGEEPKDGAKEI